MGSATDGVLGASDGGGAYVIERTESGWDRWSPLAPLPPPPGRVWRVIVHRRKLAAVSVFIPIPGAFGPIRGDGTDLVKGEVHLFERRAEGWVAVATLRSPRREAYDGFGNFVAIQDGWLAITDPGDSLVGEVAGAAFLYRQVGDEWRYQLVAEPDDSGGQLGMGAVFCDDELLLLGAPGLSMQNHNGAVAAVDLKLVGYDSRARALPVLPAP
ncbi:MAG: hypothetical protein FJ104_17385 [Deltaproteobacteria bacterium]|nr:hypothetical protein [Deltaproteobacteria bacterium]